MPLQNMCIFLNVFVPYIVTRLCNISQQMHTFEILLIQFLVSSTCFEYHVLIIRKIMCT